MAGQLNTNMRSLKRIPGPDSKLVYTLETKAEQGKGKVLCDHCGTREPAAGYPGCEVYAAFREHQQSGVKLMVRTCPTFEPLLTFRPPLRGFDGDFNTFRLGTAWYYRIGPGVVASLIDTSNGQVFGKAEVLGAETGPLALMCQEHAHNNHSMLAFDRNLAAEKMRKLLRQSYGMVEIDDTSEVTVIYLRNLRAETSVTPEREEKARRICDAG